MTTPVPFTLPPDTRAIGTPDPANDMDNVIKAHLAQLAGYNVLSTAYGADPTGFSDSTAAFLAAANALPATGGVVIVPPGTYKVTGGNAIINTVTPTTFWGPAGKWATRINFTGTGDCIRLRNPTYGGGGLWGGGVIGIYITGASAGNGSAGVHLGDGEQYVLDVAVEHFSGTSDIGVHLDNTIWWTEKIHGTIWARDCTQHVMFDVNDGGAHTATNSFGYLDLTCYLYTQSGQDGVVVNNGGRPYHGGLKIKGNFTGSAGPSNAALRVTGQVPGTLPQAGLYSSLYGLDDFVMLCETGSATGPYTIYFGSALNTITGCKGMLDFTQGTGTFTPSNLTVLGNAGTFGFSGPVVGDFSLQPAGTFPVAGTTGMAMVWGQSFMGTNGNVFVNDGDFFRVTLTGNMTVNLNPGSVACAQAPQRKTIIITQAASGGPYAVTWPHAGSPTASNPAVRWAGGSAPTMSAGAAAVDVYKLETFNGAIWYGEALQAVA